ncbi:hypothetical protein Ocin01_04697 [Orchesella cincta]|uniref:Uncharacterized protein n=1 Tax=Orchesella cincta TaxID=48709 RepID=A0A1D2N9P4_ORCCI|nr:hypothetical protein Ocin01_04697 [Orchesella cincta]
MGRHRKKWVDEPEDRVWPFEISIDLARHKPKIAFMSGCIREYYPEDPGYSKFGTTHCIPDSEDTARCTFVPSTNLLQKPISKLGYGIGGLSAPRFPKTATSSVVPAPNAYPPVVPLINKKKEKKEKRKSTNVKLKEFMAMYEKIVQEQCDQYEKSGVLTSATAHEKHKNHPTKSDSKHRRKRSKRHLHNDHHHHDHHHKPDANSKPPSHPDHAAAATTDSSHACHKKVAAFGMGLKSTRFQLEKESKDKLGPGNYNPKLLNYESFQITTPRGELIPRVRTVCNPTKYDSCMNCGINLKSSDYYQTKNKMKVITKDPMQDPKYKMVYLSLCRYCYCYGLKDELQQWDKDKLPDLFIKARHCNSVHDHKEGLTEYLSKATCKVMLSMARKELMYSRYFKDDPCQATTARDYKSI